MKPFRLFLLVAISSTFVLLGCSSSSKTETYEMGQAIEMGPFTFKVEKATAFTDDQTYDDERRMIQIIFKLVD